MASANRRPLPLAWRTDAATRYNEATSWCPMLTRDFPSRIARLAVILSLLLFGLCIAAALYLYRQQAVTAENLGENIGSRKVAAALEELFDRFVKGGVQVDDLNQELPEIGRAHV